MQDEMEGTHSEESGGNQILKVCTPLREQDRFLPIANITKIMKKSVPSNGKIAKEARECIQECVSEFISFITSEASDRCHMEKRKTINGEDILCAMYALGFENYVEPLKLYLSKYKDTILSERHLSEETHDPAIMGESSRHVTDTVTAQVLPTVIGNTEIIYQTDGNTLYFKNEPYEQM
ncbi:nuclear transcription factor Y subunit B-1 [Anopheles stephensi]|uniref:Nuclear transcription factor Y subunit beta n=1 Tax=Anopheles stephensi TaxID=30069 RepID=A0A182Y3A6_ANOST|nr:nuclear transcription factor Y subunit B-1 [Anopheles stephensi]